MNYIENPKTKGSGIICCIPQTGTCPNKCEDCFFQSGRSYLEPLNENLPNMPAIKEATGRVVRVNDGNDSNVNRRKVLEMTKKYRDKFYNTAIPHDLEGFQIDGKLWPVVLTVNPATMTDMDFHRLDPIPRNLMFVRFRVNTWNRKLADETIKYYTRHDIPVVLTFMAYYTENIPDGHEEHYAFRKRTLNSYWVITPEAWDMVLGPHRDNPYVYTCGKNCHTHACHRCGHCLREYYTTKERLRK